MTLSRAVTAILLLTLWLATAPPIATRAATCPNWCGTGYVPGPDAPNPTTADGTSVWTAESIAAAPAWVPFGSLIDLPELSLTVRVADRGNLGPCHVDIRVFSTRAAYALTGHYDATIIRWGY